MKPLADRMRPSLIQEYIGQEHLVGPQAVLTKAMEQKSIPSFILWGPPGVGKTTLAQLIAKSLATPFFTLSAIHSGVKEVREVIHKAKEARFFDGNAPILFIDEIHRFNKSQQDSLLGAIEHGTITLIGATTENPSFEIIPALRSRCQIFVLKPLTNDQLILLLWKAIEQDEWLQSKIWNFQSTKALLQLSNGDARKLYNILELIFQISPQKNIEVTDDLVKNVIQKNIVNYDKQGEDHYDVASAFIKSIRGSDPNAAVYWLARMIHGGEDVKFIARRMLISAAEDIGLANPNALLLAQSTFQAVTVTGMPEARIILSQAAIYLATSPKSNSAYLAINQALKWIEEEGAESVPLDLRNAPTTLMKD
jgi:putative ATPase